MPQAASRLALLIQLLDITGYDLATSLNIDPSLISKWKHRRRKIPGRTDAMPRIAGYLLDIDARQGGRTINPLLHAIARGKILDHDQSIELLTQWLLDPEPPEWGGGEQKAMQVRPEQDNYTCQIDVFRGTIGRRRAVLRFFDEIGSLPGEQSLKIFTQEDMSWIFDDPEFLNEFRNRLSNWVGKGHKLEVIHWLDRRQEHLQALIQHLLPLHLDSPITSYYYPLFSDVNLPVTSLIVPGCKALIGSSMAADHDLHTVLYADPATIRQFEGLFNTARVGCARLIDYYQVEQVPVLLKRYLDSRLNSDKQLINVQSRLPLLFCLSGETLNSILQANGIPADARKAMIRQWSIFHAIFTNSVPAANPDCHIRIIHHLGAIEQVLKQPVFDDPFLSAFAGRQIRVDRRYLLEYLRFLGQTVLSNSHVETALIRTDTYSRFSWPNQMVVVNGFWTAWGMKITQNRLITQEMTLVHAFGKYFQDRWQMIPRISRDRQVVSDCLNSLADIWQARS